MTNACDIIEQKSTAIPPTLDGGLRLTKRKFCVILTTVGTVQPELTPVEIVGCEVNEAGSPLALDNGQFTKSQSRRGKTITSLLNLIKLSIKSFSIFSTLVLNNRIEAGTQLHQIRYIKYSD